MFSIAVGGFASFWLVCCFSLASSVVFGVLYFLPCSVVIFVSFAALCFVVSLVFSFVFLDSFVLVLLVPLCQHIK